MVNASASRHFHPFVDPVTKVVSHVLDADLPGRQQSFYYVNRAMDEQGRFLWFYCYFPPAAYRVLGVMDFEDDCVRCFPETQFLGGPLVDVDSGECIFASPQGFYIKSPKDRAAVKLCDLPREITRYGSPSSLATHLTYSPDKTELFMDARVNDRFILGTLRLSDGSFTVWKECGYCRNHAQFNPVNGDLVLLAEDHWNDHIDGSRHPIRYNQNGEFMRLWTLTRNGKETLYPPLGGQRATHEWWSRDGKTLYYCKYTSLEEGNNGVTGINLETGEHKVYCPVPAWHAFSSLCDDFFVYDENDVFYRGTPSRVGFYNYKTGRQLYIVSQNPALAPADRPSVYHLDPHPQLVCRDQYVCYTLAQKGCTEVALTETAPLLSRTVPD